ncbi:hypothetical protein BGZ94_005339 [Podila epigama]|nr:hypothetical protein BGZ94_005339 [Podila epigama]
MTLLITLSIIVASLLSVLAAPYHRYSSSSSSSSKVAVAGVQYKGWGTYFDDKRNACPGMEYSFDEPIVAVNSQKFDESLCGLYIRANLRSNPSKTMVYKIVDTCPECDENSLDFSKTGLGQLTTSGLVPIDWEILESYEPSTATATATATKTATKTRTATTTKATSEATSKPTSKPSSVTKYTGRGTWFSDTTGSCGKRFSQSDMIVALNRAQMGDLYGSGSKCGQTVRVSVKGRPEKYVDAVIIDTCPSQYCSYGALDLSRAVFQKFAPLDKGVLELEWHFL